MPGFFFEGTLNSNRIPASGFFISMCLICPRHPRH